ncbi:recombinase family protein [Priestia filamentosa]|uniref:recombinase family protein n=1 Tax=Priestia filamentosa TaxID=1402861 RepID=UPI000A0843CF|nr:recombinase family protein [Priestia filamentosa]OXS64667.1 recombinase [Priestia filamentosa]WRU97950.1 recombinase family protein [Priestia filamentosa]SMF75024.1 Site-specific DNA recombinase [Priestia filamentosa]
MKLGYARVSSRDQNPERQLKKFRELAIEDRYIFIDKQSGKDFNRPRYQAMLLIIREGDLVYLDALDRLGRDYHGIIEAWKYITRTLKADIVILENETLFDSRKFRGMGDIGRLMEDQFLSLLSYVAEQERKKNKQRQAEGIEVARNKGVKLGRRKYEINADFIQVYDEWKAGLLTATEGMKRIGLKPNTFYRRVKEYEDQREVNLPCGEKNFLRQTNG